jgi:quinoprotein glucose dehydrogenase
MRRFVSTMLLLLATYAVALGQSPGGRTAADGVFSAPQASRGKATYGVFCAGCHADDLAGTNSGDSGAPPLKHDRFMRGSTAGALYAKIKRSMPLDAPGTLKDTDVLELVAFLLEANGFPAGAMDLPSDVKALDQIRIESAPARPVAP